MPLNDVEKRKAILEKTGFNVTTAIDLSAAEKEVEDNKAQERRVKPAETSATPGRRTSGEKYTITKLGE